VAGEAAVAVGLGAFVEEYWTQRVNELIHLYRRLQQLRRRILQEVEEEAGEDVAEIVSNIATAIRRYAPEIEEALAELRRLGADPVKASLESVVEEYAEVLRLDIPVGGGKTLEDLLYESRDEVLDKLHEIMMALYMEYVEINEKCDHGCPPGRCCGRTRRLCGGVLDATCQRAHPSVPKVAGAQAEDTAGG